jgi:hypothetical protein
MGFEAAPTGNMAWMTQSDEPDVELLTSKQRGILPPKPDEQIDRETCDGAKPRAEDDDPV